MEDKLAALDPSDRAVLISDSDGPGATDKLAEVDGDYVRYTTWAKPGGEKGVSIKDRGTNINIEPVMLNVEEMAVTIEDTADELAAECTGSDDVDAAMAWAVVRRHADDLAANLLSRWQAAATEVAGIEIHDGHPGLDGRVVWTAHGEEALYREVRNTVEGIAGGENAYDYHISDGEMAVIKDELYGVLRDALHWAETPGMSNIDYAVTIELQD
ncbi:hypothetical protein C478_07367 [Natrinema thermotolerans DSM 11552]|nr:hypothetical protein C478_07367 [Natrinema thermotolerans DSM 11552]